MYPPRMHDHRFKRLARLTQGVALLGLGVTAGCHKDPPPLQPDDPHINAPPDPPASASAPTPPKVEDIHVNSPPTPPSAAPSASAPVAPSASVARPKHTNAPGPPPPPKKP